MGDGRQQEQEQPSARLSLASGRASDRPSDRRTGHRSRSRWARRRGAARQRRAAASRGPAVAKESAERPAEASKTPAGASHSAASHRAASPSVAEGASGAAGRRTRCPVRPSPQPQGPGGPLCALRAASCGTLCCYALARMHPPPLHPPLAPLAPPAMLKVLFPALRSLPVRSGSARCLRQSCPPCRPGVRVASYGLPAVDLRCMLTPTILPNPLITPSPP